MITNAFILTSLLLLQGEEAKLPAFPSQWTRLSAVSGETKDGAPIFRLDGAGSEPFNATGCAIMKPPIDREIKFTVWLRSAGEDKTVVINSFAYDSNDQLLKPFSRQVQAPKGVWVKGESTMTVPAGTASIRLFVINSNAKPLDLASPTLTTGGALLNALGPSGVLRASSGMAVTGKEGTVYFPVPGPTAEQAPISFRLRATPEKALLGYEIKKRNDNWVCEAHVAPTDEKPVVLRWESVLLIRSQPAHALPKAGFDSFPNEAKGWLGSSPVVQSDDAGIVAKAKELKAGVSDVETFARKVIDFTSKNEGTGKPFVSLDAAAALGCGGSCTSRANLAAALLRAGGVPARTISHLPTWAYGSGLYEHWLVEYWHPGAGWVRVEPTLGQFAPTASTFAALATATVEDERATGKPGQLGWIMPGAAWMSGIQGSDGLMPTSSGEETGGANWCRPERNFPIDDFIFRMAVAAWPKVMKPRSGDAIEKAAMNGSVDDLKAALRDAGKD